MRILEKSATLKTYVLTPYRLQLTAYSLWHCLLLITFAERRSQPILT